MGRLTTVRAGLAVLTAAVLAGATGAGEGGAAPAAASAASTSVRTPVAASAAVPVGTEITVLMSGDMLVHSTLTAQARRDAKPGGPSLDFYPMLRGQRPRVSAADLAICHLETPIAQRGGPYTGYPAFKAPAHIVTAIRQVGYDACTTASNHSLDDGFRGVRRTLDVLDSQGIEHTGTARSATERSRPLIKTVKGVKVGIVSATYGTNGIPLPQGKSWSVNVINRSRLLADARAARRAGADVVVVAVHAGTEYQHQPNSQQRQVADYLTRSKLVDGVYFHHAHVAQPIEKMHYRWVAWGLGNSFATSTTKYNASTGEQLMVRFTFRKHSSGGWYTRRISYVPGYSPNVAPYRWVDLVTRSRTSSTYEARRKHVSRIANLRGGFADGLTQAAPLR